MQITDYIESKAIREHFKDYNFNMIEAAWVVWNSDLTFDEQNNAWLHIMDTMPDCKDEYGDSFKERLKKYVDGRIAKYLEITEENDKYVYSVMGRNEMRGILYDNFKTCFDRALKESFALEMDFFSVTVNEKNTDNMFILCFSIIDGEKIEASSFYYMDDLPEEFLEEWIFSTKHPFKKGDIVCIKKWGEPMVVVNDGSALCVYMWDRGKIVCEDLQAYHMDYYDGLFEAECVTQLISNFLKSGEGLEDLLNEYHRSVTEKMNTTWEDGDVFL